MTPYNMSHAVDSMMMVVMMTVHMLNMAMSTMMTMLLSMFTTMLIPMNVYADAGCVDSRVGTAADAGWAP